MKKYLISGIIVLVPIVATIWILRALILWLDGTVLSFVPYQFRPEVLLGFNIPGLGLLVTITIILITGIFTRLYVGRKLVQAGDTIFSRVPFGRAIYQATKQVLATALSDKGQRTRRAVLVEFPKPNSYAMGFVTGNYDGPTATAGKNIIVFVPTAPNPTSGFLLIVPENSIIPTNLTTEEASKLLISGGLLAKKTDLA